MKIIPIKRVDWIDVILILLLSTSVVIALRHFGLSFSESVMGLVLIPVIFISLYLRRIGIGEAKSSIWGENFSFKISFAHSFMWAGLVLGSTGLFLIDQSYLMGQPGYEDKFLGASSSGRTPAQSEIDEVEVDFSAVEKEAENYEKSAAGKIREELIVRNQQSNDSTGFESASEFKKRGVVILCLGILLLVIGGAIDRTRELRS